MRYHHDGEVALLLLILAQRGGGWERKLTPPAYAHCHSCPHASHALR